MANVRTTNLDLAQPDLTNPLNTDVDRIIESFTKVDTSVFQALKRTYAEAGYNLVAGSFERGGTIDTTSDVLLNVATGAVYRWAGVRPKTVAEGSTPASSGGISGSAWVAVTTKSLKDSLAEIDSASLIGGVGAGKVSKRVDGFVSILEFGVVGDGATNNNAALVLARDYLLAQLKAGNRIKLVWPAGRYVFTVCPNWAMNRLYIEFSSEAWLINNGTGSTFIMDGGATGPGVYGCVITGYPQLYGGSSSQNGCYLRAVHRSDLELEGRGAGSAYSGLYQEWNVSNTIKFIMNFNAGGLYNTPARGITQTLRNANEETSYCLLVNPETSGMPVGIYQDGALGNVVLGGAIQACTSIGVVQTANAWNNKFAFTDFEANAVDVECNGRESQFVTVDLEKKIVFKSNSINCSMLGGVTESIQIDAGSQRTLLSAVVYNRFGQGTIVDNALTTRYRDLRNKVEGLVHNKPRAAAFIPLTGSPFTYTNTSGQDEQLIVKGGTVSSLALTRFAGYSVPVQGTYILQPGDSLVVTYTADPEIVKFTT